MRRLRTRAVHRRPKCAPAVEYSRFVHSTIAKSTLFPRRRIAYSDLWPVDPPLHLKISLFITTRLNTTLNSRGLKLIPTKHVLHRSFLFVTVRTVKVLIDSFQPTDIVVRMRNEMHVNVAVFAQIAIRIRFRALFQAPIHLDRTSNHQNKRYYQRNFSHLEKRFSKN